LNKISEDKTRFVRCQGFMNKLKYVTDQELIGKYIEAEAHRNEWFESQGWDFTPNVDPKLSTCQCQWVLTRPRQAPRILVLLVVASQR
jgi:hypothetical protein